MPILKAIKCDIPGCLKENIEKFSGSGFEGWGELRGVSLNGVSNPSLCPDHLIEASKFIDSLGINK